MEGFEKIIQSELKERNRKVLKSFLAIMLTVDISYFLMNLTDTKVAGFSHFELYSLIMILEILFGLMILAVNKWGSDAVMQYVGFFVVFYASGLRLIYLSVSDYNQLAIIPYIGFYFIFASLFFYRKEIFVSLFFTQVLLVVVMLNKSISLYEILSTVLVTTILGLFSVFIGFSRYKDQIHIRKSELNLTESKNLLDEMLARVDTLVILINPDGTIYYINEAFEKITGKTPPGNEIESFEKLFTQDSLSPIEAGFDYVIQHKKPYVLEKQVLFQKDDHQISLKIYMDYLDLNDRSFVMLAANDLSAELRLVKIRDIIIRLNNMLSKESGMDDYFIHVLISLVETIPYVELGSILIMGDDGLMAMRANVGYSKILAGDFRLKLEESFFYRNCKDDLTKPVIINDLSSYSMEGYTDILENERRIQVASSLSSPIIIEGKFCGLLNLDSSKNNIFGDEDLEIMQFLTDQISHVLSFQQLLNKTIYLSRYDQLTGLLNRWYLKEFETVILPHAVRFEETFIFVMMDINHLKRINDTFGHAVGDYYLCEFSRIAKENARETDLSIRIGGDEFVGIYFEISSTQLIKKLDRMNEQLRTAMATVAPNIPCTFAYGMASFPAEGRTADEIMKLADQRMYEKKLAMR